MDTEEQNFLNCFNLSKLLPEYMRKFLSFKIDEYFSSNFQENEILLANQANDEGEIFKLICN